MNEVMCELTQRSGKPIFFRYAINSDKRLSDLNCAKNIGGKYYASKKT